jgi:1-acyl-sn-glycerol-3-phosphate acyltransferase
MNPQPSVITRQRVKDKSRYQNYKLRWPARALLSSLHFGMWLWLDVEKQGWENIPRTGPVIMMINHVAFLDPVILTGLLPRPVVSMAKVEAYEDKIIGPLLHAFDSIPVNRGAADLQALRRILDALEAGLAVLIAPEGHRSESGGLGEAHEGIAFVAYRAKVPIVPVGISGTPEFKHNYWKMQKTHVTYRFGQPFYIDSSGERVTTEMLKQMTDEAMYQLAALLPPEQRGLYDDLDKATAKYVKFVK